MHVLQNWSTLCTINIYDKLNMLIVVCYNLYCEHNTGKKVRLLVFKEKRKFKKKCLFLINFIPSMKRVMCRSTILIFRTKVLKLFLDEFISSRCRTNNVSVKIKEVIDNFKENALIIPLACKLEPVKVLVIERERMTKE